MRLLLFNPETEYALASGASFYTPPKSVVELRRALQLLPEQWADPDDFILVDDTAGLNSRFCLVSWADLRLLFERYPGMDVDPWGWNPALIRRLKDHGVPPDRLPDHQTMTRIRNLAHRRTTIVLNTLWNRILSEEDSCVRLRHVCVPRELSSIEECMEFYRDNPGCWLKAPWSSSGRGVVNTAADMTPELVRQWCHGILRRQGSVMGETAADRIADFASEWMLENGKARFLGLSCFNTSGRGKYISNEFISQEMMRQKFNALSEIPIEEVLPVKKRVLEEVLDGYNGPCGADMLIERSGALRPFVELNLRRTMGMLRYTGIRSEKTRRRNPAPGE